MRIAAEADPGGRPGRTSTRCPPFPPGCLVTDRDETEEDREGHILDRLDLLYGAALGAPERAWIRELAPHGEAARDRRLVHRVAGVSDWRP